MAKRAVHPTERYHCSLCQRLLIFPVTLHCGHSFCHRCIEDKWDDKERSYICFLCRPHDIRRSSINLWKTTQRQYAPADHCYAGAEDVACDMCSGRKRKALKSCLVCLASYCDTHLQPHYDAAPLRKHQLVEPSKNLQENICSQHGEVMKMFCRSDQQCVCYLCSVEEHKGHDIVSAAAESREKQRTLQESQQSILQRIQNREKVVRELQQEVRDINHWAHEAVDHSREIYGQLIRLMQERSSEVEQKIRSQQEAKVRQLIELEEKLKEEIAELRSKDAELQKLSHTEDHCRLLHRCSSAWLRAGSFRVYIHPRSCFEDVTAAVSVSSQKIQQLLEDTWTNTSLTKINVLLSADPQPQTRAEFLRYSRDLTLDPSTAHKQLILCKWKTRATLTKIRQPYPHHPDRFISRFQVLSRETLTGRHYWEVELQRMYGRFCVAVAYDSISRTGDWRESGFGADDKSWALYYDENEYEICYNSFSSKFKGPRSHTVGVYLDHSAGLLSFYNVDKSMTLLYRVQTSFTEPLYAGLGLWNEHSTAEIPKLR